MKWLLDADLRSFFDSVDHEWLLRMVAHSIADPRILRLLRLWLRAGVLESGKKQQTHKGTQHGAPQPAHLFLHYVLDRRHTRVRIVSVRYADDSSWPLRQDGCAGDALGAQSAAGQLWRDAS